VRESSSAIGRDLPQVWINPKFDGEGNMVDGQRPTTRDEETLLGRGSSIAHSTNDHDSFDTLESGVAKDGRKGERGSAGRRSEASVWIVQGPRESDEVSDEHSDAILELRDLPKELGCRDSVQMKVMGGGKGMFGRLRGGEGKRDRFRHKLQRLLIPPPIGTSKSVVS